MADGSEDLFAKFDVGQDSESLFAKFIVRQTGTQDLYAKFYVGEEWGPSGCQRKRITITEASGGNYTDYPTMVDVAYEPGMDADFSNVRFTEWDGTTPIPFGLISVAAGVATFIIKRTYTRATKNYIWIYYGKPQASGAVAYSTWLDDWYSNNGFGPDGTAFTDAVCSSYPYNANGTIPAWVEHVVAALSGPPFDWGYAAYYGRMKINGVPKPWATQVVCNGIVTIVKDKWNYASLNSNTYDDAAFVKGANNVMTWGHFSEQPRAVRVAWWPKEPTITFRAEEEQSGTGDLFADLIIRNADAEDLKATFDVGQDSEGLFADLVVRHSASEDLYAKFETYPAVDLFADFIVRQTDTEDLFADLTIRQSTSEDLFAEFELQKSTDLFAKFTVRHAASADLCAKFYVGPEWSSSGCQRKTIAITEASGGNYTDYPTLVVVTYTEGMDTDFTNVRFTEWDGTTPIPFGLISKVDGVSANFVLKRTYTRATKDYIWIYYGKYQPSGAVAYSTWLDDWYNNNGFGPSTSGYTDTTCSNYPRTANGTIPAWVEHVVAGIAGIAGKIYGWRCYYGRMKINGVANPWASTVVCNGIVTRSFDHWGYASLNSNTYDDAAFVKGANNVTTWGHYSGSNNAVRVAWWPKEPLFAFGPEQEQADQENLFAKFDVGQGREDLFADLIVRNADYADLKATFLLRQETEDLFAEFAVFNYPRTVGPSTVTTVANPPGWPIPGMYWRGGFYAHGKHFIVHGDGTGVVYRHSSDEGTTWSAPVTVRATIYAGDPVYVSVHFDGVYLHYAMGQSDNQPLLYRRGLINSDGSISWSAAEQTAGPAVPAHRYRSLSLATDSEGYPVISYMDDGPSILPYITKSSKNDGTWSTEAGYPLQLSAMSTVEWRTEVISLGSKRLCVRYSTYNPLAGYEFYNKIFDGSSWGAEEGPITVGGHREISIARGPNSSVLFSYNRLNDIRFRRRPWGGPWGAEVKVLDGVSGVSNVVTRGPDGSVYIFQFTNYGSYVDCVIYAVSTDGGTTWKGKATGVPVAPVPNIWIDETTDEATQHWTFSSSYQTWDGVLSFVYITKNSSPYNVRYAALRFYESADLKATFHVGQDSADLKATFHVGQDSKDLFAKATIRHSAAEGLFSEFIVRNAGTADLFAEFELQKSEDLFAEFVVRHTAARGLFSKLIIRNVGIQDLFADLIIRHTGTQDLFSEFIVRQTGTADLFADLIIRNVGAQDLFAKFAVRQTGTQDLFAKATIRRADTVDLFAEFAVRQPGSQDLFSEFVVRQSGYAELFSEFSVSQIIDAQEDLFAKFIIRKLEGTADLPAEFIVRHSGFQDLSAELFLYQVGSAGLFAKFLVVNRASVDLFSTATIRHSASEDLEAGTVIRHSSSVDVHAEFIVRQMGSSDLKAIFEVKNRGYVDLYATFRLRQDIEDLFAKLVVRGYGIAELLADFYVRQPTWLWTSKHYLEGVVNLNEQPTVTDAVLEYVIEGVMVDVKSFLIRNELPYEWEDITTVPKLIKRATTYGTVASLFARGFFSHRLTVSIPPRSVTVIDGGGHDRAMDYWEGRMEEMLELYSSSVALEIFWVSTEDEEPVFSMEDIPMKTGDPYKYDTPS